MYQNFLQLEDRMFPIVSQLEKLNNLVNSSVIEIDQYGIKNILYSSRATYFQNESILAYHFYYSKNMSNCPSSIVLISMMVFLMLEKIIALKCFCRLLSIFLAIVKKFRQCNTTNISTIIQ